MTTITFFCKKHVLFIYDTIKNNKAFKTRHNLKTYVEFESNKNKNTHTTKKKKRHKNIKNTQKPSCYRI